MIEEYANAFKRALVIDDTSLHLAMDRQGQFKKKPGGPGAPRSFKPPVGVLALKKQQLTPAQQQPPQQ